MTDDTTDTDPADDNDDIGRGREFVSRLAELNDAEPPEGIYDDPERLAAVGATVRESPDLSLNAIRSGSGYGQHPQARQADAEGEGEGEGEGEDSVATNAHTPSSARGRGTAFGTGGLDRRIGFGAPGKAYNGRRDIWETLGYPETELVTATDYIQHSRRTDVARIITTAPVETSWKIEPEIYDASHSNTDEETEELTEFDRDVATLLSGSNALNRGLLHYLEWADREQRPCQYGLIFLGLDDGRPKSEPVDIHQIDGPDDLRYVKPFSQANVEDWDLARDLMAVDSETGRLVPRSDRDRELLEGAIEAEGHDPNETDYIRPDKPITYNVLFNSPNADGTTSANDQAEPIHCSRVIHVVEQPVESEFIGESCLLSVLNRLIDYEKVVGASAEMFWSGADRKFFLSASSGGGSGGVSKEDVEWIDQQFRDMQDNMRSSMYGANMDLTTIDGQAVDPSGFVDILYQSMAGVSGMPKRIMTGSERGELASSMDQASWFGRIVQRQKQVNAPSILRPVFDRLITFGVVATPVGSDGQSDASGEGADNGESVLYHIDFPSLFELTDKEKAEVGKLIGEALVKLEDAIAMGADRRHAYAEAGFDLPEKQIEQLEEDEETLEDMGLDDLDPETVRRIVDEMGDSSSLPGIGAPEDGEEEDEPPAPPDDSDEEDEEDEEDDSDEEETNVNAPHVSDTGHESGRPAEWSRIDAMARGRDTDEDYNEALDRALNAEAEAEADD